MSNEMANIAIEYYDVASHKKIITNTAYGFCVFFIVDKKHKQDMFTNIHQLFEKHLTRIIDTNIRLKCYPNTLIDYFTQNDFCERLVEYMLCGIECHSLKNCNLIFNYLKNNNPHKHFFYLINSLNISYMMTLHLLIESNTIESSYIIDKIGSISFMKSKIPDSAYNDTKILLTYFDPKRVFISNGIYQYHTIKQTLTLYSGNVTKLYQLLPMVSFDIETITNNLIDVPIGCSEHEEIISYVLHVSYLTRCIIVVCYVRFDKYNPSKKENVFKSELEWAKFDDALTKKYYNAFKYKYSELHLHVQSFNTESELLQNFVQMYCKGSLLRAICGNDRAKHFFTGHNIIKYDLPVMLRRFKWHSLHSCIDPYVTFNNSDFGADTVLIKFNKNAYIIDSYRIFDQQHLCPGTSLALKSLTNSYLPTEFAKIDLDPVIIRAIYIIVRDEKSTMSLYRDNIVNIMNQCMRISKEKEDHKSVDIEFNLLPNSVTNVLNNGNLHINSAKLYTYDQFLEYNILDCESVVQLWKKFNYSLLFSLILEMYPCNLERALQSNATSRIKIAFDYNALKYQQVLSTFDFSSIGINKTRCITPANFDMSKDLTELGFDNVLLCNVQYKTTKKKYAGAAVLVQQGIYENCVQMDVASQYPNILRGKRLFTDSVDGITIEVLLQILNKNKILQQNFNAFLLSDIIQIYLAEEINVNYKSYLTDFSTDNVRVVGHIITTYEELQSFDGNEPILLYIDDSKAFVQNFINDLLTIRKELQANLAELKAKNDLSRYQEDINVLDSKQKFVKVTVNSMYGAFGNSCIPVAALTTLFGRKSIVFSSKYVLIMILKCLHIYIKIYHYLNNKQQLSVSEIVSNDEIINEIREIVKSFDSVIFTFLKKHTTLFLNNIFKSVPIFLQIVGVDSINEMFDDAGQFTKNFLKRENIEILEQRINLDGHIINSEIVVANVKIKRIKQNRPDIFQEIYHDVPNVLKNLVFDCDTDGLQFVNVFQIDALLLLDMLNFKIAKMFHLDNIIFEKKESKYVMCLAKKKYTTFKHDPRIQINNGLYNDIAVSHSGYERNALPCFKKLCKIVAVYCILMHKQYVEFVSFKQMIFGIFNFFHKKVKKDQLYISIKMNKISVDSVRKRFIEKYSTTYTGSLKAVYVVSNTKNVRTEELLLLHDYICNPEKYTLHYAFFLRTFGKIWYTQHKICSVGFQNEESSKLCDTTIVNSITEYFNEWLNYKDYSTFDEFINKW